jgi:acetyl esterase/lipase
MAMPAPTRSYPDIADHEAWRSLIAKSNQELTNLYGVRPLDTPPVRKERIADVPVIQVVYEAASAGTGKVYLDFHGGALILFGGDIIIPLAQKLSLVVKANVVSVDYRMPPDHPYPAGLDDCVAVYKGLLERHGAHNIVIGGASAGGNLALATILRAKAEGLPMPAGLALLTPEIDLTESGDSFQVLKGLDRLGPLIEVNRLYAGTTPLTDPYVSPLFGDFSGDFPRTFIQAGTRDLFLSNAVRLHRALRRHDIEADLHIWEALPHGGFLVAPEDAEIDEELYKFTRSCWNDR